MICIFPLESSLIYLQKFKTLRHKTYLILQESFYSLNLSLSHRLRRYHVGLGMLHTIDFFFRRHQLYSGHLGSQVTNLTATTYVRRASCSSIKDLNHKLTHTTLHSGLGVFYSTFSLHCLSLSLSSFFKGFQQQD